MTMTKTLGEIAFIGSRGDAIFGEYHHLPEKEHAEWERIADFVKSEVLERFINYTSGNLNAAAIANLIASFDSEGCPEVSPRRKRK
jgi:hypothetical protein